MSTLRQLVQIRHARLFTPAGRLAPPERAAALRARRRLRPLAVLGVAVLLAGDAALPARAQPSCLAAKAAIHVYRAAISPLMRGSVHCRFIPSCSRYSESAFETYGTWTGVFLTLDRLSRCQESVVPGTRDPVPTFTDAATLDSGSGTPALLRSRDRHACPGELSSVKTRGVVGQSGARLAAASGQNSFAQRLDAAITGAGSDCCHCAENARDREIAVRTVAPGLSPPKPRMPG